LKFFVAHCAELSSVSSSKKKTVGLPPNTFITESFYIVKRRWETTLVGIQANLKRSQTLSFLFFPNLKLP
jgi:hypothetical protein